MKLKYSRLFIILGLYLYSWITSSGKSAEYRRIDSNHIRMVDTPLLKYKASYSFPKYALSVVEGKRILSFPPTQAFVYKGKLYHLFLGASFMLKFSEDTFTVIPLLTELEIEFHNDIDVPHSVDQQVIEYDYSPGMGTYLEGSYFYKDHVALVYHKVLDLYNDKTENTQTIHKYSIIYYNLDNKIYSKQGQFFITDSSSKYLPNDLEGVYANDTMLLIGAKQFKNNICSRQSNIHYYYYDYRTGITKELANSKSSPDFLKFKLDPVVNQNRIFEMGHGNNVKIFTGSVFTNYFVSVNDNQSFSIPWQIKGQYDVAPAPYTFLHAFTDSKNCQHIVFLDRLKVMIMSKKAGSSDWKLQKLQIIGSNRSSSVSFLNQGDLLYMYEGTGGKYYIYNLSE